SGNQGARVGWAFDIPAGGTRRLMFLQGVRTTNAEGLALADRFAATTVPTADVYEGLTPEQLSGLVNWGGESWLPGGPTPSSRWDVFPDALPVCTPSSAPDIVQISDARIGGQVDAFDGAAAVTVDGDYLVAPEGSGRRDG